jgi:predicted ATPase
MLTHLKLDNFKIWKTTGPTRLAPVTLLLGTNSSGKSSLIQSLLLIRQTVNSTDANLDLYLGDPDKNDSVTLGQFKDVLCRQGVANEVIPANQFGIEFSWLSVPEFGWKPEAEKEPVAKVPTVFTAHYRAGVSGSALIDYLRLGPDGEGYTVSRVKPFMYRLSLANERSSRGMNRFFRPQKSFSFPPQVIARLGEKGQQLNELGSQLLGELGKIIYLGPLRRLAQRDYIWSGRPPSHIEDDGSKAIDVLIASGVAEKKLRRKGHPPHMDSLFSGVTMWLERMGLATGLEVERLGDSYRYELLIVNGEEKSNLKDVGVGVSQVLPVIVAALFAKTGHIVIVEEPESHLHPMAQSELANLFTHVSQERGVQFIVETHSEHLFRRVQTLVAEESVSMKNCALYFVERDEAAAKLRHLVLDAAGRVSNWPPNFFGNSIGETRRQAEIAIDKAIRARSSDGSLSN